MRTRPEAQADARGRRAGGTRVRLAALLVTLVLGGCATPQYQNRVRLVPPDDAAGRACVQHCESTKMRCQRDCTTRYQACTATLEPQVEARYAEALEAYAQALRRYASALRWAEFQLRFDGIHGYAYRHPYRGFPAPYPFWPTPYPEPQMPTRDAVRAQLATEQCQADCGCLPAYDGCFVGCGGTRLVEPVCVRHCPEGP